MNHEDLRLALGAYVLGALEPTERSEVATHVEECAPCRAELAEFAPLLGLLGQMTPDEVRSASDLPAPEGLLDAALGEVAARRRSRRRLWVASVAAAAVVIAALGVGVAVHRSDAAYRETTISATDANSHVRARAVLYAAASGTTITLTMRGVPFGERCRLVAIDHDGHREVAGTWRASYSGGVSFSGSTAIDRSDLSRLEVVTFGGRTLVRIPVT